jgi:Polymer-forming cytoskeletal
MSRRGRRQGGRGPDEPSEAGIKETLGPEMTVVGRGARLEGTLVSTESIRIDGQAKGKIAARVDVILSSDSHVEADIQVEGTIRSKALVVSEGDLFSGQASIDLQDAPGEAAGFAHPADEMQMGYDESVRRAADWYRSTLYGPTAEPAHNSAEEPDAGGISKPDEAAPDQADQNRHLSRLV